MVSILVLIGNPKLFVFILVLLGASETLLKLNVLSLAEATWGLLFGRKLSRFVGCHKPPLCEFTRVFLL